MRISVKEEIETDEAEIMVVESFEWAEDVDKSLEELASLNSDDIEELKKEFNLLEELE